MAYDFQIPHRGSVLFSIAVIVQSRSVEGSGTQCFPDPAQPMAPGAASVCPSMLLLLMDLFHIAAAVAAAVSPPLLVVNPVQ